MFVWNTKSEQDKVCIVSKLFNECFTCDAFTVGQAREWGH